MNALKKALLVPALLLAACGGDPGSEDVGDKARAQAERELTLTDTHWALVQLQGEHVRAEDESRRPWIELLVTKHRLQGFSGCNQFGGEYQRDGNRLRFGAVYATKMACPGVMNLEQGLFAAISQTRRFEIADGRLVLKSAEGPLARFEARPEPAKQDKNT